MHCARSERRRWGAEWRGRARNTEQCHETPTSSFSGATWCASDEPEDTTRQSAPLTGSDSIHLRILHSPLRFISCLVSLPRFILRPCWKPSAASDPSAADSPTLGSSQPGLPAGVPVPAGLPLLLLDFSSCPHGPLPLSLSLLALTAPASLLLAFIAPPALLSPFHALPWTSLLLASLALLFPLHAPLWASPLLALLASFLPSHFLLLLHLLPYGLLLVFFVAVGQVRPLGTRSRLVPPASRSPLSSSGFLSSSRSVMAWECEPPAAMLGANSDPLFLLIPSHVLHCLFGSQYSFLSVLAFSSNFLCPCIFPLASSVWCFSSPLGRDLHSHCQFSLLQCHSSRQLATVLRLSLFLFGFLLPRPPTWISIPWMCWPCSQSQDLTTCRPIFLQRPFHVMLSMRLRLPPISSNIQIIASLLLYWITRSLMLIDSSSDFCSGLLGLVACFFSFWFYLSLVLSSTLSICRRFQQSHLLPVLVTSVQTDRPSTSDQVYLDPGTHQRFFTCSSASWSIPGLTSISFKLPSNHTCLAASCLLLLHSVPVSVASLFGARILGTRFLIFIEPTDTHDNDA